MPAMPPPTESVEVAQPRSASRSSLSGERFAPGHLLVQRFRIVMPLGKGGMGEVFRADDLALGQSVALKFLSISLSNDADRLQRLRGEVRTARQVAHPNVCRVYDLGDANGHLFISMEFVDGQNLGALLQQINRLPEERGVEIARQLCLGLGAIHDRGLLHRDLKPANIMLDGRGHVRITDFGLAVPTEQVSDAEIRDGTPAYQSPEQLTGREVTPRSDIYALGLILYELFTGKRPFAATNRVQLARSHAEETPSRPSSHISGLNPAIETIILRCLEKEPRDRPRSAYDVLAGLPGGDPLQAALAAGQTPSPGVVADAKVEGTLHPLVAISLLVATLVGMVAAVGFGQRQKIWELMPHQLSPRDLAARAQEMIQQFGYTQPPFDSAYGLADSEQTLKFLKERDRTSNRWNSLAEGQPPAMFFWYRQSSTFMRALGAEEYPILLHHGQATADNPGFTTPGMVRACLDLKGRLIEFQAVPTTETPLSQATPLEWPQILKSAGLIEIDEENDQLRDWLPPLFVDQRRSWRGVYADCPSIPIRAKAGLLNGRLVFFHVSPIEEKKQAPFLFAESRLQPAIDARGKLVLTIVLLSVWALSAALAWHNVRAGRANIRGTALIAGVIFAAYFMMWIASAHHVPDFLMELEILTAQLGHSAWWTALLCIYYLALEPYIRRRWPWRVVAWNRALAGRWRDPLVGRDILIGLAAGTALIGIQLLTTFCPTWLGRSPVEPWSQMAIPLAAGPGFVLLMPFVTAAWSGLISFLLLFLFYLVTRREWLAVIVYIFFRTFLTIMLTPGEENYDLLLVSRALMYLILITVILRYGLLALTALWTAEQFLSMPLTLDTTAWYSGSSYLYFAVLAALTLYGFVASSGGQVLAWVQHLTGDASPQAEAAVEG